MQSEGEVTNGSKDTPDQGWENTKEDETKGHRAQNQRLSTPKSSAYDSKFPFCIIYFNFHKKSWLKH